MGCTAFVNLPLKVASRAETFKGPRMAMLLVTEAALPDLGTQPLADHR